MIQFSGSRKFSFNVRNSKKNFKKLSRNMKKLDKEKKKKTYIFRSPFWHVTPPKFLLKLFFWPAINLFFEAYLWKQKRKLTKILSKLFFKNMCCSKSCYKNFRKCCNVYNVTLLQHFLKTPFFTEHLRWLLLRYV